MADPGQRTDFAVRFVRASPGFAGDVTAMDAFFDETSNSACVAGVAFDQAGLKAFTDEWQARTASLPGPYRTAACQSGRGAFANWSLDRRNAFLDSIAELVRDTYKAAVVTSVDVDALQAIWEQNPRMKAIAPNAYTLCLLDCLHKAAKWPVTDKEHGISYWFESGAVGQITAAEMMSHIDQNLDLKARFRINSFAFVPKESAAALCAADFLAWEWRRNMVDSPEKWRDRFEIIRRAKRGPIFADHIRHNYIGILSLLISTYGLTGDRPHD